MCFLVVVVVVVVVALIRVGPEKKLAPTPRIFETRAKPGTLGLRVY